MYLEVQIYFCLKSSEKAENVSSDLHLICVRQMLHKGTVALVKISRTCKMSHYSCWVNISATLRLSNNVILKYDL